MSMKLLFKQRFLSFMDSYDIYDETGQVVYQVYSELSWGHKLVICDPSGRELGTVRQEVLTFLPAFRVYEGENYVGAIMKKFTFFSHEYDIDFLGWRVEGEWLEWDYRIYDEDNNPVAAVSKELFNWTDTYVLEIEDPMNQLYVLMFVLAIDAEKCSRNRR